MKIGGCANPDMVRLMREWIGNDEVGIVVGAVTVVDEDGDLARAHAQQQVEMYLEVVGENDPTFERAADARPLRLRRDAGRGRRARTRASTTRARSGSSSARRRA